MPLWSRRDSRTKSSPKRNRRRRIGKHCWRCRAFRKTTMNHCERRPRRPAGSATPKAKPRSANCRCHRKTTMRRCRPLLIMCRDNSQGCGQKPDSKFARRAVRASRPRPPRLRACAKHRCSPRRRRQRRRRQTTHLRAPPWQNRAAPKTAHHIRSMLCLCPPTTTPGFAKRRLQDNRPQQQACH